MTARTELVARMRRRYDEQCERFPRTREIGWPLYLRRNLPSVLRLDLELSAVGGEALAMYRKETNAKA